MKILAIRLGTWGAVLGMLAGVVELSLAWMTVRMARKHAPYTDDGRLATILGVLVLITNWKHSI